jgi:hypothetical protein
MPRNLDKHRTSGPVTNPYEGACDLLYAAQQLRAAAAERGDAPALAATVGCIDAALGALTEARERTAPILAQLTLAET